MRINVEERVARKPTSMGDGIRSLPGPPGPRYPGRKVGLLSEDGAILVAAGRGRCHDQAARGFEKKQYARVFGVFFRRNHLMTTEASGT